MHGHSIHDKSYKYLFSNPLIVKELLESFVAMEWIKEVDFSKAQPVDKSYVNDDYKEYEADIIYKLMLKDAEIYLYLLIEFQSTVDNYMSFRMLTYIMELYRELIYKHKVKQLPVVFPILLYNGERKWTAATNIFQLINVPEQLQQCRPYIPQFQYYPIIENEILENELDAMMNVIATVFLLERGDKEIFLKTIDRIRNLMHIYGNENMIIRTLLVWLAHYLETHGIIDNVKPIIESAFHPEEAYSMLSTTLQHLKEDLRKEGYTEGLQSGFQDGVQKGMQEGLQKGMQKGMQLGMQKGVVRGKQTGLKEGVAQGMIKERAKIASKMITMGMDDATILKITKLDKNQLESLKNMNHNKKK